MITSAQIREYRFEPAGEDAYSSESVDKYMSELSSEFDKLYSENREIIKRLSVFAKKIEDYKRNEGIVADTLLTAQKSASLTIAGAEAVVAKMLESAKEQGRKIIETAKKEADDIRLDRDVVLTEAQNTAREMHQNAADAAEHTVSAANKTAEEIIDKAKSDADILIAGFKKQADDIIAQEQADKIAKIDERLNEAETAADKARKEAESIISQAKSDAESLTAQAAEEAEKLKADAAAETENAKAEAQRIVSEASAQADEIKKSALSEAEKITAELSAAHAEAEKKAAEQKSAEAEKAAKATEDKKENKPAAVKAEPAAKADEETKKPAEPKTEPEKKKAPAKQPAVKDEPKPEETQDLDDDDDFFSDNWDDVNSLEADIPVAVDNFTLDLSALGEETKNEDSGVSSASEPEVKEEKPAPVEKISADAEPIAPAKTDDNIGGEAKPAPSGVEQSDIVNPFDASGSDNITDSSDVLSDFEIDFGIFEEDNEAEKRRAERENKKKEEKRGKKKRFGSHD